MLKGIRRQDIFLIMATLFIVALTWTVFEIKEDGYVPSGINGITTSISLVMASIGALVTLSVSRPVFGLKENTRRFQITIVILGLSATALFSTYVLYLGGHPQLAVRVGLAVLIVVAYLFVDVILFLIQQTRTIAKSVCEDRNRESEKGK